MNFSRRQLARYAVEQMLAGKQSANIAEHLAAALIASKKIKEAELLLLDIDQELEDHGLIARARVTSARELSDSLRGELISQIKKLTGVKEVVISNDVDEAVLGGVRIETANHGWDKTTRKMLMDIKEAV